MVFCVLFFKQKTSYEMRISDWSSDVCSSDLPSTSPKMAKFSDNPISSPARTRTVKASAFSIRFPDRHFHTATVHHSSAIKSRHYRPEWLSRRKQGSPSARKKLRDRKSTRLNSSH